MAGGQTLDAPKIQIGHFDRVFFFSSVGSFSVSCIRFSKDFCRRKIIFLFVGPSEVRGELVKLQQVKQKCGLVFSLG